MAAEHQIIFDRPTPGTNKTESGYIFHLEEAHIMGILNVTPDSFSDGNKYIEVDAALAHAKQMISDGASFIDVGGESTRPGAEPVDEEEEIFRVLPVIEKLALETDAIISIDSYKPAVVEEALAAGAHMANDISGGRNETMFRVCANFGAPIVLMHMQGNPLSMQENPNYIHVVREVSDFLIMQAGKAKRAGINSVIIDPGIGFGKKIQDNLDLIRNLRILSNDMYPLLLGASRKSLIPKIEGRESGPLDRDPGSIALHLWGLNQGANIIRVHNVRAHAQAMKVWSAIISNKENE